MASAFIQGHHTGDGDPSAAAAWETLADASRAAGLEPRVAPAPPEGGDLAGAHRHFDEQRRALLGAEVLIVGLGRPSADSGVLIGLAHSALIPIVAHWPRHHSPEPGALGLLVAARAALIDYGSEQDLAERLAALLAHRAGGQ